MRPTSFAKQVSRSYEESLLPIAWLLQKESRGLRVGQSLSELLTGLTLLKVSREDCKSAIVGSTTPSEALISSSANLSPVL